MRVRANRTVSVLLVLFLLLSLMPATRLPTRAAAAVNPNPVYNRAAAPEVAILNAVTGNNAEFYKSVQGSKDWNAVEAGYFGSLRYNTKIEGGIITSYQWNGFQNTNLSKLRDADHELQIGYSVTKKSNYHSHSAKVIYTYNMTSYCLTCLGFNTGGIVGNGLATYSTYSKSQDTKRYGNNSYATFIPQSGSLDIAFNQSHIKYDDYYCNCGGTASGCMVCFYDGVAPTVDRMNIRNASGSSNGNFKPGDTVEIILTCSEGLRFADDSASGKGDIYIGLKLNGSTTVLYPHLTKLDGNELTFSLETSATDENIYDIAAVDLTAAPSGGTPLFGSSANVPLKQLNSRHAFTAKVPGGSGESGITKTTCPITDMAGNALHLESWQGDASNITRHFYIDGEKPYAIAAEINAVTNNGDVKELLDKTGMDPNDPNYIDFSDTYLGVGDSLSLKLYMNEIVTGGNARITTNIKKSDGSYVWFRAYPRGSVNAIAANLGAQFGLGASNGSVSVLVASDEKIASDMIIDDSEGKIRVTSIEYSGMSDKAGNIAADSTKVLTPDQQYHLDTTPPTVEVSDVTGANRTSYGFRVPFKVTDNSGADGVLKMPATLTLGGGTLTGKLQYAVTGKTTEPEAKEWQDGAEGVSLNFLQSGDWQYLHVRPIEGEHYSVVKLSFTPRDYAGNWATTTEVSVSGVGLDGVGPTVRAGNSTRSYDNAGFGTLTAYFTVSDVSSVHQVQYQWNDGTELTAQSTGWMDAVGTLGETSVDMTVNATVPSGEAFKQTLWVKAEDTVGNISVTSLGEYSYNLAGIHYELEYSSAVTSSLSLALTDKDADGVVVFDVQKKNDNTHYIQIYNQYRPTSGNIFYYQTFYTADFDDSDGYKFTNLAEAGNKVLTKYMEYTGDITVTVYSGVVGKTDEHGTTGDIFRSSGDTTADIIMTTNTKTETFALHYSYAYNWERDVFSKIDFRAIGETGVGALTGPWEYAPNYTFQKSYSLSTLEGMQVHFDLGEDINGWDFSDIDWEKSFIGLDGYGEDYKLCGIGYGPVQTITLPASDRYTDGYHHIYLMLFRRSYQEHAHKYYSNGFNAYVDTTEPGTLELGILGKWDNYLGGYSSVSYDPSKTIYIPTQQCDTCLSVDVLDLDGTPHEMTSLDDYKNIGEVSVIAWNVSEPDKIVNLERAYLVEENGVISRSEEGTGTNSKRLLHFGLGTDDTDKKQHVLGLALEQDSVIALQVRYANGRASDITYLTVHPISIGLGGTASAIPFEIGTWPKDVDYSGVVTADPGKAAVIFTPYEGHNFTGLKVYCQEAYETHWAYDTYYSPYLYTQAFTPLPGTEPIELEQQADGTFVYYPETTDGKTTGIIRVADDGTVTNALADDKLAQGFYCFWAEDQYGNRDSMAITGHGVIADGAAPVVTEKSLTSENGCYTATFKIYDDSLFTTLKSTNTAPVFDVDPPRPMTLTLSYDNDYGAAIGASDTLVLENVWNGFTWKTDEANSLGIYEVTATLTQTGSFKAYDYGDTYNGFPTDAYMTVTVKGIVGPNANNAEMTLNLEAMDAHGNLAEPVGVTGTVSGVQPAVIAQQYKQIDDSSSDMALFLTFNTMVQPEESWINRSIEGFNTEWHDAFPIWKDGEWRISFTDFFGKKYTQTITLNNVIGAYGFDLGISTLDYVPAAEGVTLNFLPDDENEQISCGDETGSTTVHENGTVSILRSASGQTDTLNINLNNLVSGGPAETLYFYLEEFKEQYIAGSAEQFTGTTTGAVTVSYRTDRDTSPVGDTTVTILPGSDDSFTLQYFDAPTNLNYTISGRLSDFGITLEAPAEPYRDEDAPTVELVTVWKQRAVGFVQAEAFPGFADEAEIAAALERVGTGQSYDLVVKASDTSRWKLVVKSAEPTEMSYATAASDAIPGISVIGNNVYVTDAVTGPFWIVLVDNAAEDSAATADNFTVLKIPGGSWHFDTTPPEIVTQTVDTTMYSKTVYIKVTDIDNDGNPTDGVTVSGPGVVENSDANAAEYPWKIVFTDNDTTVPVTATDAAGNMATASLKVDGIDLSLPKLSVSWSPCFQDPTTGRRDTANPTLGPVNTNIVAHVTSTKPIAGVTATYSDDWHTDTAYDFDNPPEWGTIAFDSQRVTVRFGVMYCGDTTVRLTVSAPNGGTATIPLTVRADAVDLAPPRMYFDHFEYQYREGYDVPYAATLEIRPTGDDVIYCANYGPSGKAYYDGLDEDYSYLRFTMTEDTEQVFVFVDKAGNVTQCALPADENDINSMMYNVPAKYLLEQIDSKAPVFTLALDDDASAENGVIQATVTANEACTLSANDAAVTCSALTQGTDGEGKTVWTGTVTFDKNATYRLTATDLAGNRSTQTFTVNNIDKTLPLIGFTKSTVSIRQDSDDAAMTALLEDGVTTWDNVEIKAGTLHYDASDVMLDVVGVYRVTYTVEDAAGNVGQAIRYVRVTDKNQPIVTVDGVATEYNGVLSIETGAHVLSIGGLKTPDEPYKLMLVRGVWSAGQIKRATGGIRVGADGSFTLEAPGFYTLYIITQSRQTYRALLNVED